VGRYQVGAQNHSRNGVRVRRMTAPAVESVGRSAWRPEGPLFSCAYNETRLRKALLREENVRPDKRPVTSSRVVASASTAIRRRLRWTKSASKGETIASG